MEYPTLPDERLLRRRRYTRKRRLIVLFSLLAIVLAAAVPLAISLCRDNDAPAPPSVEWRTADVPSWIEQDFIRVGGSSRSGAALQAFHDIVIHYVGNPGTTAKQNRNYFDNPDSSVSSHFIVGLDGEIVQCLPLSEVSAASNHRNSDTVSIEVCHPDGTGKFNDATYQSLLKLVNWLLDIGGLSPEHVIRHYDVTGKECPRYYVRNPEAWEQFLLDVAAYR